MIDCQKRGHIHLTTTCEDCNQVIDRVSFLPPSQYWISVHDQLPKKGQLILVYIRELILLRVFEHNGFHDIENDYYTPLLMRNGVSHWMAVPEPPK